MSQLKKIQTSEQESRRVYDEHLNKCGKCRPKQFGSCKEGVRLHNEWNAFRNQVEWLSGQNPK